MLEDVRVNGVSSGCFGGLWFRSLAAVPQHFFYVGSLYWWVTHYHASDSAPTVGRWWPNVKGLVLRRWEFLSLCATMSTISLLAVNVDRYLALEAPLKSMTIVTARRAKLGVSFAWISLGAEAIPPFGLSLDDDKFKFGENATCYVYFKSSLGDAVQLSMAFVFFSLFPIITISIIHARIVITVRKLKVSEMKANEVAVHRSFQERFTSPRWSQSLKAIYSRNTRRYLNLDTSVCAHLHFYSAYFYEELLYRSYMKLVVNAISLCNNWINIYIYTVKDRRFRKSALKLLFQKICFETIVWLWKTTRTERNNLYTQKGLQRAD